MIGLEQFFNQRASNLSANAELTAAGPVISDVTPTDDAPDILDEVWGRDLVVDPRNPVGALIGVALPQIEGFIEEAELFPKSFGRVVRASYQVREVFGVDGGDGVEEIGVVDPLDDVVAERCAQPGQSDSQGTVGREFVGPRVEECLSPHREPSCERQSKREKELTSPQGNNLTVHAHDGSAQDQNLDDNHSDNVLRRVTAV